MTITSSITSPTEAARPPKVMMLKLMPSSESTSTAAASEAGTISMASRVMRQLRRKNISTTAASTMPIRIASRTEVAAATTSVL